jgi:N-acyl-D-aspartate/D-glutamate deacylase
VAPESDKVALDDVRAMTEAMFRDQAAHLQAVNEARQRSQRRESIMLVMTSIACAAAVIAAVAAIVSAAT